MKCIDDELIQRFIDHETDAHESDLIKKHLAECALCTRKVEEQRTFAEVIKIDINNLGNPTIVIPQFTAPTIRKHQFNKKIWYYITAASVACAICLVGFFQRENKVSEYQIIYCFDGEFDSNRPYSQHEMTIKVFDSNGKMIEFN